MNRLHNGLLNMYFLGLFWRGVIDDVTGMNNRFLKFWKSRLSSSTNHERDTKGTRNSFDSGSTVQLSRPPLCLLSPQPQSTAAVPSKQQPQSALTSELRWKRKYDVFVCHSSAQVDVEEATRLVSFLEASPCSLRCFLWQRDTCPGGAISTEFCQALQNSHLRVLLLTPSFIKDDWCGYMMHQVLAEEPMSSKMIPLIQSLPHSQYPQELKFYYYIDLSRNPNQGYTLVNKTVLKYLDDLVKKETLLDSSTGSSSGGLEGEDKPMIKDERAGTFIPLEVMPK